MEYQTKLYFETGLYLDNCLDSLYLLDSLGFRSLTVDSVWLLQDRFLNEVKVAITYDAVKNADYAVIGSTGYWINGIRMVNENVCILNLMTDYITTIGVSNIQVISGWCSRRCVTVDDYFQNTIEEPFTPSKPLKLDFGDVIKPPSKADEDYQIVVSTVKLEEAEFVAQTYKDEANDLSVTVPQVPSTTQETTFHMGGHSYNLPKAGCYNYRKVDAGIQAVRSLGIESCITASYTLPANYVGLGSSENVIHGEIGGIDTTKTSEKLTPVFSSNIKNKKALSGQFTKYVLMSLITGEKQEFNVEEIVNNNQITWRLLSDPLPEGYPIAMPAYFHGHNSSGSDSFFGAVRGANWQQNPIQYTTKSGSLLDQAAFDRSLGNKVAGAAAGAASVAAKVAPKVAGAASSAFVNQTAIGAGATAVGAGAKAGLAAAGITSATTLGLGALAIGAAALAATYWYNTKKLEFQTQQNIIAPEIPYTPIHSLQNYYGNFFQEYRYRLEDSDLQNFDRFLTAYGYAVSEPLTDECFKGRQNFNYVEATNILLKTNRSKIETMGATEQLTNGVRIWHTAPTQAKLYDNPITGGK